MKRLLTAVLALALTGCFSNKSDDHTNPGPGPKPPVTAIKGVFRKNAPATPAASTVAQGLKAPAASTVAQGLKAPAATSTASVTMSTARKYHRGIKLLDGKLLIFGGSTDNNGVNGIASAEVFDPATELFTPVGSMSVARILPSATRMPDGRVVVVGGSNPTNLVDIYDPATQTWTGLPTSGGLEQYTAFVRTSTLIALPGNRVLFYGGQSSYLGLPWMNAQVIDLTTGETTKIIDPLHQRSRFATVELNDGTFLVTGGETATGTSSDIIKIDPATLTITKIGQMTTPRTDHSMLVYPDGLVEVYGGVTDPAGNTVRLTSVETINPTTGVATKVGDFTTPRSSMQSNILQNGISLHGGGPDKDGFVADTQLTYEHGTNLSTVTNQMVFPRVYFVSLVMNNGRVLYAGGTVDATGTVTNTAEIFDSYSLVMIQGSTDQVQLDPTAQATIQMTLVSGGPVTWTASVGTVDASGLWTAPKWVVGSKNNPTKVRLTATATADSTIKAAFDATLVPFDESTLP